jgi:hypothetical protein
MFDPATGLVTDIPPPVREEMIAAAREAGVGPLTAPTAFVVDHTIYYVSPTIGMK